ncbi:MAG: rpoN [Rhodospirillales bacterium]|nr:rpoN [Rhodospirillales bacterium]
MSLVQRLDLRQAQTLVMTPQLQQAIKLLQLSNLEIGEFVDQELQQNPLLEESGHDDQDRPVDSTEIGQDRIAAAVAADDGPASTDDQASRIDAGALGDGAHDTVDGVEIVGDRDTAQDGGNPQSFAATGAGGRFDGEASDIADRMSRDPTLRDHLLEQLNTEFDDPKERLIGAALIEAVEPTGYLADGPSATEFVATILAIDVSGVESVLKRMQQFDPPGVMARNLSECLSIQLRQLDRFDPAMEMLCRNLDLLANRRFGDLSRLCGVDSADLSDMIAELRKLDPKPGEHFESSSAAQTIIPDILMRASRDGGWSIELNPDTLPRVLVNRRYYAEVSHGCKTAADREYLTERLNAANWLIRSLDQRAQTILKVASEIINQQEEFFLHGVSRLRPLVLRNIAEIIGMHESTVSRVTSNKFISTPRGMFELKYFFSTAIPRADGGESFAAEAIRHRLRDLIDSEDPDDILSDDTLVEQLQQEGMDIARRTVAKYREQLGIPSSVQRRRQKNFAAAATR